jgi:pilus assembly protein Flp/PilA
MLMQSIARWARAVPALETCMETLRDFVRDETAATAIEYGLITAGICIAIITAVNMLGTQLQSTFTILTSDLASAGK